MSSHTETNCEIRYDSARASYAEPEDQLQTKFDILVQDINRVLGPTNGIDSADVDVQELQALMAAYQSDEHEWSRYAFADSSRPYTRNLVDHGNGKSNLVSINLRCIFDPHGGLYTQQFGPIMTDNQQPQLDIHGKRV